MHARLDDASSHGRSPLGTHAFVLLLVTTLTGALAVATPDQIAPILHGGGLATLGRAAGLLLAAIGSATLARSYHALRRAHAERVSAEAEARTAALTDELTGVYNRRGFRALAEHQLRIARRTGSDVVLLYGDMDGFKSVNDRHGHLAGDAALREVGELLRNTVRETDVVGRLGGDEFAILVVDADDTAEAAVRGRIARALASHNARGGRGFALGLTLGSARLDANRAATLDELVHAADAALYAAKRQRRIRVS